MPAIQIRNVPDDLHARLKEKAASQGQSLSEYALSELRRSAARLTMEEALARIAELPPVDVEGTDPVAILREERDRR